MKQLISLLFCVVLIACSKGKSEEEHACWHVYDASGSYMGKGCDYTEAEIKADPTVAYYFKDGTPTFCWVIGSLTGGSYVENLPADYFNKFYTTSVVTKVDCGYCARWFHRIKRTYKPANTFYIDPIRVERFCADTVKALYQGKQDTLKNTADSLVVRQFSNDGTTW